MSLISFCLLSLIPLTAVSSTPEATSFTSARQSGFEASVTRISDGDSVTVRYGDLSVAVRLAEIDAPERGQAWSKRSQQELSGLVAGKVVRIIPMDRDRYGRTVARLEAEGRNVNREMVRRGAAWAYRAYLRDTSLLSVEAEARAAKRGLWSLPENANIPPWEQRRAARNGMIGPEL